MDLAPSRPGEALRYNAVDDKHLRRFYARPAVQRHVAQSRVKAAVAHDERDPWTQLMQRLGPAVDARRRGTVSVTADPDMKRLCGCLPRQECAFCISTMSREAVVSRSTFKQAMGNVLEPRAPPSRPSTASHRRPMAPTRPQTAERRSGRPALDKKAAESADSEVASADESAVALHKRRFANVRAADAARAEEIESRDAGPADEKRNSKTSPRSRRREQRVQRGNAPTTEPIPVVAVKRTTKPKPKRIPRPLPFAETQPALEERGENSTAVAANDSAAITERAPSPPPLPSGRELRAAVTLQSWFRGIHVRLAVAERHGAAALVQKRFRSWFFEVSRRRASRLIQAISRGCRMRVRLRFVQLRVRIVAKATQTRAAMCKEELAQLDFARAAFFEHSALFEDAAQAQRAIAKTQAAAWDVICRKAIDMRQSVAFNDLLNECDNGFDHVLRRKNVIVAISARLVDLERQQDRARVVLDNIAHDAIGHEHHRIQRFGVERVAEEAARNEVVAEASEEMCGLIEAAAMDDLHLLPLTWLRETESVARHFIITQHGPHLRLHRDEYARVRLAFSESERRKLIGAVEKSEKLHLERQITRALAKATHA